MSTPAEDEQARLDARWAAYRARSRRSAQKFQLGMVAVWVVLAVFWWINPDADPWMRWAFTGLAVTQFGLGVVLWRQLRRPLPPVPGKPEAPGR